MLNLTKTDKFILSSAALLLVAFSYFLYDDSLLFPRNDAAGLPEVGSVSTSQNDVRLKNATAFSWFPASTADKVHQQDSVFTGAGSEASIRLNDGSVLNLKENSLVTLNQSEGQMTLNLRYGDFVGQIAGESNLKVQAGEKSFDLQGDKGGGKAAVRINLSSSGDVDLKLLEGNVKVQVKQKGQAKAVEQKLTKDKSLSMSRKGAVEQVAPPKIQLVTPDGVLVVRLNPNDPIPLKWKTEGGDLANYDVDLCADPICDNPVMTIPAKDQKADVVEALKDGQYLWRVRGFDKFGAEVVKTAPRTLNVAVAAPPVVTTPGGNEMVVHAEVQTKKADEIPLSEAKLSWETRPHFATYPWQLAKDPEFKELVQQGSLAGGDLVTPKLPNGVYYYRVRGILKTGPSSAWSPVAQFKVDLLGKPPEKPSTPRLLTKKIDFDPSAEKQRNPASVPAPVIKWTKAERAETYKVQFSKDPSFKTPLSYSVPTTAMTWTQYRPGVWHVRVIGVSGEGLAGNPSDLGTATIIVADPRLQPIEKKTVRGEAGVETAPPSDLKVEWNEVAFATKYELEVADNDKFENAKKMELTSTTNSIPVPKPGSYFFRVRAFDEKGESVGEMSPTEKGIYVYKHPMETPRLMEPFDKASIFLQSTAEPFIWLEWKKVKDTGKYEIEVATEPSFKKPIVSFKTVENRYLLRQAIPVGKLYWRVRALVEEENLESDWSNPRLFQVVSRKNEDGAQ